MKKLIGGLLVLMLLVGMAGCSSSSYQGVIDSACKAMEKGDVKALTSLLDMKNIEKALDAIYSGTTDGSTKIKDMLAEVTKQEDFVKLCDDLEYRFDEGYTVSHGSLFPDEEAYDLKLLQRLRKLEASNSETLTLTEFINTFIDSLTDVISVKTTVIVKSKDSENKTKIDVTFVMYKAGGKWYLDFASHSDITTPNMLLMVRSALSARDSGN